MCDTEVCNIIFLEDIRVGLKQIKSLVVSHKSVGNVRLGYYLFAKLDLNDMMDTLELRKVMGQFATGVTVITTQAGDERFGFTANSYTSVSLDPPLILFCLHKDSKGCPVFLKNGAFAVNILADDQIEVSNGFANRELSTDERYELVSYTNGETGSPVLDGAMGYLDCRLSSSLESGDHVIFIGEVIDMGHRPEKRPLIYFQGGYRELLP